MSIQAQLQRLWSSTPAVHHRLVRRYSGIIIRIASILLGLLLWEWYAAGQPPYLFPNLAKVYQALIEQIQEYALVSSLVNSLQTLFAGYALAAIVGILLGLWMGLDERVEVILNPYINALYVAPVAALVPIIILIGGIELRTRIFVVFLFTVFEIIVDTYQGVKTTPRAMLDVARSFCAGRLFILRNVVIPNSLPYIFAGLRLGIGRAVKGMIIAELLIEFTNLGRIIRLWQQSFRIAGILSVVLLLMLLGIVLTLLVQVVERRLLKWQHEMNL